MKITPTSIMLFTLGCTLTANLIASWPSGSSAPLALGMYAAIVVSLFAAGRASR